jgi:RNA polymerase sigma-70 factor (ECF subfamily)
VTDADVPVNRGDDEPSSGLLQGVKAGKREAWDRLVRLYAPLVYLWCRRAGLQAADAADVGQEVFRAVARKVSDFRRDRAGDSFRGWLRTVARHKIYDQLRGRHDAEKPLGSDDQLTRPRPGPYPGIDDSGSEEDREELALLYRRAVELIWSDFEDNTSRAFWAVVMDDRPVAEVAQELGVTTNAVYLAKARVLRRLRAEFADLLDE